ncbi:MAG TPA: DUF2079 domain-containing protein [Polyangiaceae bacterium]|nr:DUF2079 domain-containing protein [Polyangiaceae bacterium]
MRSKHAGDDFWFEATRLIVAVVLTAAVTTLAVLLRQEPFFRRDYFWQNWLPAESLRHVLVTYCIGAAAVALLGCCLVLAKPNPRGLLRLRLLAARTGPIAPLSLLPCLFSWRLYDGHDLAFLLLVLANALAIEATVRRALTAGLSEREQRWLTGVARTVRGPLERWRRHAASGAAVIVVLAVAGYVTFFAYNTVVWHRSVRSGFDLAIENNILWNLLHGGPFFHASPVFGPSGSHFGRHATLISYVLLPLYALHQDAETLHVLQAAFVGAAAIPLFLFAKRRIGNGPAALIALVYLLYPAVEESNLFEMQYTKLAPAFFWTALALLDAGRIRLGLVAAATTLLVREDVASWIFLLGVYVALSRDFSVPRWAGAIMAAFSFLYVLVVKFAIMPRFLEAGFDLVFMYRDLLPHGRGSFASVLVSVFGNPAYALESMFDVGKLLYVLQLLVPLAFIPFRRGLGLLALIPGFVFCLLSTKYGPLIDIHYQYSPHVFAFEFPATVMVLEGLARSPSPVSAPFRAKMIAPLAAIIAATLPCSYQYGALLQSHTSRGGPIPFKFGWDDEGRGRHEAIQKLRSVVPESARVAASAFTVPQFSSRADDYSLSLGIYDADWLVAPARPSEYVGDELSRVREALSSGQFGVVAIEQPFFAARRNFSAERNEEVLRELAAAP